MIEIIIILQTLFFIYEKRYVYVVLFIGFALMMRLFSKNKLLYLIVPIILTQLLYIAFTLYVSEGFLKKPKWKKRGIKGNISDARRVGMNYMGMKKKNDKQNEKIKAQNEKIKALNEKIKALNEQLTKASTLSSGYKELIGDIHEKVK
jgi:hypothetical protein